MRRLRSGAIAKIYATMLLASLLSFLVSPVMRFTELDESVRYADWVRTQLGGTPSEVVEVALASALDADAERLDGFIEAFIEAYVVAARDADEDPVAHSILFGLLQHRYGLLHQAVVPHLLLKSALVRTLTSQDRAGSLFVSALERLNASKVGQRLSSFIICQLPVYSFRQINAIGPRAP